MGDIKPKSGPTEALFGIVEKLVCEISQAGSIQSLSAVSPPPHGLQSLISDALLQFIQWIGKLWSSAQSIRSQMKFAALRHPISYTITPSGLRATATILIPSVRTKVAFDILITPHILENWPTTIRDVEVNCRVIYGSARYVCTTWITQTSLFG